MSQPLKVVTWNLHLASATSPAWHYLLELDPDIALLQEVNAVPPAVTREYACLRTRAMGMTAFQNFHTVILVRGEIGEPVPLNGSQAWIDDILATYAGNLPSRVVHPRGGPPLKVISAYSPSWPIPWHYFEGADIDALRPTQQHAVWLVDLLLAALEHCPPDPEERWIIAGDLNLSVTFDHDRRFAGGNGAWLERMSGLGLVECLRKAQGGLKPTFKHSRGGILHQIDHLFVTQPLASQLVSCDTGNAERVFGSPLLSDHLPVIATFAL